MTVDEAKAVIETLRKQGMTDEQIQHAFAMMYFNNQMDLDALDGMINLMGYHLTNEFKTMSKEQQFEFFKKVKKFNKK